MSTIDNGKLTALVTGASRGIGRAVADILAENGYNLILTCNSSYEDLKKIAVDLSGKYDVQVITARVDAGNYEEVSALFDGSAEDMDIYGYVSDGEMVIPGIDSLDVLVNNAGVSYVGLLHEMKPEDWNKVMSTNSDSVFYTCKFAIPLMLKEHKGRIVNISSVWGSVGASTEVAYSASKGAVNSFTKALAKELAPSGITVNAVACGLIDTKMNECFSEEDLALVVEEIPADRIGQPEEVALLVLQLINSPDYLTGQIIKMDGGWT